MGGDALIYTHSFSYLPYSMINMKNIFVEIRFLFSQDNLKLYHGKEQDKPYIGQLGTLWISQEVKIWPKPSPRKSMRRVKAYTMYPVVHVKQLEELTRQYAVIFATGSESGSSFCLLVRLVLRLPRRVAPTVQGSRHMDTFVHQPTDSHE